MFRLPLARGVHQSQDMLFQLRRFVAAELLFLDQILNHPNRLLGRQDVEKQVVQGKRSRGKPV
jgi:hypothetical protein